MKTSFSSLSYPSKYLTAVTGLASVTEITELLHFWLSLKLYTQKRNRFRDGWETHEAQSPSRSCCLPWQGMKSMFASLPWLTFWSSISHTSLWPAWQYSLSPSQWKLQGRRKISLLLLLIQSLLRSKWHISSNFSYFISLFWGFLLLKGPMALFHLLPGALKAHAALKQLNIDSKTRASSATSAHCGLA